MKEFFILINGIKKISQVKRRYMKKVFSIITATYNAEDKIQRTLESIVTQDSNLYEYIIVDGKSSDSTIEIIQKYQNMYSDNIKYISEKDQGIYDALNKGIDLANGEYLYFIGAGDTLTSNVLSLVSKKLNFKTEIIYGNVFFEKSRYIYGGKYDNTRISVYPVPHQGMFYNKEVFNLVGKYDLRYKIAADYILNIKCFGNDNIDKHYINTVIATYEQEGLSSLVPDGQFFKDKEKVIEKYLGKECKDFYKYSGRKFFDYIQNMSNQSVIILGCDEDAISLYQSIQKHNEKWKRNIKVKCFMNYCKSDKTEIQGVPVIEMSSKYCQEVDKILVSQFNVQPIISEFYKLGYVDEQIIISRTQIYSKSFIELLENEETIDIMIFGAGESGQKIYKLVQYYNQNFNRNISINSFLDNNSQKWGGTFCGVPIVKPSKELLKNKKIVIASLWMNEIQMQLLAMELNDLDIICGLYGP